MQVIGVSMGRMTRKFRPVQRFPLSFTNARIPPPDSFVPKVKKLLVMGVPADGSPISKTGSIGSAWSAAPVMKAERMKIESDLSIYRIRVLIVEQQSRSA